jgi:hypothetical protein
LVGAVVGGGIREIGSPADGLPAGLLGAVVADVEGVPVGEVVGPVGLPV